ncbi:hypothetical protein [Pseudomonas sp. NPDC090201]|uniref:hypothetical protein n=1 Tax=Pseudomonas sp. NPDC090201 TaxID=3364475 RepID=UPI00381DC218
MKAWIAVALLSGISGYAMAGDASELTAAQVVTSLLTIIGAICVFIVSQVVLKLVIEPVQQLKAAIGLAANTLLRYQGKITNASTDEEVAQMVKSHAADLMSKAEVISGYCLARWVFGLPTRKDIRSAAQELNLIGYSLLSAFTQHQEPHERPTDIFKLAKSNSEALSKVAKLLKVSTSYPG